MRQWVWASTVECRGGGRRRPRCLSAAHHRHGQLGCLQQPSRSWVASLHSHTPFLWRFRFIGYKSGVSNGEALYETLRGHSHRKLCSRPLSGSSAFGSSPELKADSEGKAGKSCSGQMQKGHWWLHPQNWICHSELASSLYFCVYAYWPDSHYQSKKNW